MGSRNLLIAIGGLTVIVAAFVLAVHMGKQKNAASRVALAPAFTTAPTTTAPAAASAPAPAVSKAPMQLHHASKQPAHLRPRSSRGAKKSAPATSGPDPSTMTARGYRILADLSVAGDGMRITFAGMSGKTALLNVRYAGTRSFAKAAFAAFLHRYGDSATRYRVRWIGPARHRR